MTDGREGQPPSIPEPKEQDRDPQIGREPSRDARPNLRALGAMALAMLLYLVLADLAIETFLGGSRVRWVVLAIISGYLTATVLLWRRLGWAAKARLSLLVALVTLTITVWLPEGATSGVILFDLPTSIVLSAVTALAIAISGLLLTRMKVLPPLGKLAIHLLAAYGIAAFIIAGVVGVSYPDMFHGRSLWTRLPSWLQGAFLGVFLIVPLGLLALLIRAREAFRLRQIMAWAIQAAALVMSLVIALGALSAPSTSVATPQATRLPPSELASRLQTSFSALENASLESAAEFPDAKALADRLGADPQKLFEWVRDETYWVAYRGVLRDHAGVLLDRLGNSLDRSLLLYALLRQAGQEARLAHAMLSHEQGQDALRRVRPAVNAKIPVALGSGSVPREAIDNFARRHNLDSTDLHASFERQFTDARKLVEATSQRVPDQLAFLQSSIPDIGGAEDSATILAWQLDGIRDHWWVQWRRGGEWIDLDVLLPDAVPGRGLVVATETVQPTGVTALPKDLLHTVTVTLIVEFREGSTLREVPILSQDVIPAASLGEHIILRHIAPNWPRDLDPLSDRVSFDRMKMAVLAQHEWVPLLTVGSISVFHSVFSDSGDVRETSRNALAKGAEALGGRVRDILSAPSREPSQPAAAPSPSIAQDRLTAEWLEYEIHSPGQPPRKIRRQIFDLIGPAIRSARSLAGFQVTEAARMSRGLALLGVTEILPLPAQVSPAFVAQKAARRMLTARDVALTSLEPDSPATRKKIANHIRQMDPASGALYNLALARSVLSPVRGQIYIHTPNIFTLHRYLAPQGDTMMLVDTFDIAANDIALRPGAGVRSKVLRLHQGIVDTNAEALLPLSGRRLPNAADLLARHRGSGVWVTLRGSSDREWQSLNLPPDVRERIKQELAEGHAVVVPRRTVPVDGGQGIAWWTVDPRTGRTLGMGESGWGSAGTEQSLTAGEVAGFGLVVTGLIDGVFCAAKHADQSAGERAAWKCFLISMCLLMGGALGLASTFFTAGLGTAYTGAVIVGICGLIQNHM